MRVKELGAARPTRGALAVALLALAGGASPAEALPRLELGVDFKAALVGSFWYTEQLVEYLLEWAIGSLGSRGKEGEAQRHPGGDEGKGRLAHYDEAADKDIYGDEPALCQHLVDEVNADESLAWTAAMSPYFEGVSMGDMWFMQGAILEVPEDHWSRSPEGKVPVVDHADLDMDIPDEFDSRDRWGPWVHEIRNQAMCGSCWAFSASEVLSDRFAIASKGKIDLVLSPEDMVSCDKGDYGCRGGILPDAWEFLKNYGIVTDGCFPYTAGQNGVAAKCIDNDEQCEDGEDFVKYKAANYYQLPTVEAIQKDILLHGPVQAGFKVYKDFIHYSSGVYHKDFWRVFASGGHAVKIVGWGVDAESGHEYWTVANSWTNQWGEDGFFRIRRGNNEVGIESSVFAGLPDLSGHIH